PPPPVLPAAAPPEARVRVGEAVPEVGVAPAPVLAALRHRRGGGDGEARSGRARPRRRGIAVCRLGSALRAWATPLPLQATSVHLAGTRAAAKTVRAALPPALPRRRRLRGRHVHAPLLPPILGGQAQTDQLLDRLQLLPLIRRAERDRDAGGTGARG